MSSPLTADEFEAALADFAPTILSSFRADGVALVWRNEVSQHGRVPKEGLVRDVAARAVASSDRLFASDHTVECGEANGAEANGIAGALVMADRSGHALCLFRQSRDRQVRWAGAPDHEVEIVDGMTRLVPRLSFQLHLETVRYKSDPWLALDIQLASSIGCTLMMAWNERRSGAERVRRQTVSIYAGGRQADRPWASRAGEASARP